MGDLPQLVAQLDAGATDLLGCLSSLPELSKADKLQLVLADQKYRVRAGEPSNVEHYLRLLPWLSSEPELQRQIITAEFSLRLGTFPASPLLAQFETNYARFGEPLLVEFRSIAAQWNQTPLDRNRIDALCDQFEDACSRTPLPRIEAYLQLAPTVSHSELLRELILIETHHRRKRGETVDWPDYQRRFPEHINLLEQLENGKAASPAVPARPSLPTEDYSHKTEPRDLAGSYISKYTFGDLRNGRYHLVRQLGKGAFGEVYLAQDMELKRQVAVKRPSREALAKMVDVESYLVEAQTVAALDHPHIVTVYDVGRTLDGSVYVVSKFIDGCSLGEWVKTRSLDFSAIAKLLERIAGALHHAHQRRLIHRDIKPANILIEEATGTPYVADFGLAIREEDYLQEGRIAGTPAYMSPEQVRGEGHRLDGRSDLFSLGVVMYWMLTGRLPFPGQTREEVAHEITTLEPPAPRLLKSDVPAELERICLKLLSKRASDRYSTGQALAEDLVAWLTPRGLQISQSSSQRITPRGLRSFTAEDAGFFLELLPGPRNREGLPESIAFWKAKIEQGDPDQTFTVGLLYGPSGCGKSSLVKAGLIPSLSPEVMAIYIEATPEETESRILRQLRKRLPELPSELGLAESAERIRRSDGPKVVLIIDQFEQWLYTHRVDVECDFVRALRQCDGGKLQAILMIRDDFYLAAARLMNHIDVPIVTDQNFKLVDLFDLEHARRVLSRFGEAYDKLPAQSESRSAEQTAFIDQVVEGLAESNKVVSVRLSLLADMLKGRQWIPGTLESIGGLEGIGISFLEETFASSRADARHRAHQVAVRGVLRALLPDSGTDIKGAMRSEAELLEASGYANRMHDFKDLLRILDGELRLLTPTDPEGSLKSDGRSEKSDPTSNLALPSSTFFQLTHDYLVPSLREWLTRKQRETKKGRAELKLAERAAAWSLNKESKQLPTLIEWLQIVYWTKSKCRKAKEKLLMRAATFVHVRNLCGAILVGLLVLGVNFYVFQQQLLVRQQDQIRVALDTLQKTHGPAVPDIIGKLVSIGRPDLILTELTQRFDSTRELNEKLPLAFALARFGQVEVDYLLSQIDTVADSDTSNLIEALAANRMLTIEQLKKTAGECTNEALWRRKVRLGLVALGVGDTDLPKEICEFESKPDQSIRTLFINEFPRWKLNRKKLIETVKDSDSSALRSAICIGLGKIPANLVSVEDREDIQDLMVKWFALPDSTTHSAVAWLIRAWELRTPVVSNQEQEIERRNWFSNFQGTEMVRVVPPLGELKPLRDPKEYAERELEQLANVNREFQEREGEPHFYFRYKLATVYYRLGAYELALAETQNIYLVKRESIRKDVWMAENMWKVCLLRLFVFARLQKSEEAERELEFLREQKPESSSWGDVESLVFLWLGRKEDSVRRLERAYLERNSTERESNYRLACAYALFAASDGFSDDEKRNWIGRSLELLEGWSNNTQMDRRRMRIDTDLTVLHKELRFQQMAAERTVPEKEYWLGCREVTIADFAEYRESDDYKVLYAKGHDGAWPVKSQDEFELDLIIKQSSTLECPHQNLGREEAIRFCNWLSHKEGRQPAYREIGKEFHVMQLGFLEIEAWEEIPDSNGYRLPTEEEWEYACRSGSTTDFSFGSNSLELGDHAWFQCNSEKKLHPVCQKIPNAFGLFDMHGNVGEWCWGLDDETGRGIVRGGSFLDDGEENKSNRRGIRFSIEKNATIGFRLALNSPGLRPKNNPHNDARKNGLVEQLNLSAF